MRLPNSKSVLISLVFFGLVACQPPPPPPDQQNTLIGQGLLPVSTTNPYLGSNIYLGQQAAQSDYLFNFLTERGSPLALEVTSGGTGREKIYLYYPKDKVYYSCELQISGTGREWVITGPFLVNRTQYRQLSQIAYGSRGEPPLIIGDKVMRLKRGSEIAEAKVPIVVVPPPPPKPKYIPKKKAPAAEEGPTISITAHGDNPAVFKPLNSDQQAIQISKGYAARTPEGDAIHNVVAESETLESISKWYAGSESSAEEIATFNHLAKPWTIKVGDIIKIPLKLLKETKQMPKS